MQFVQIKKIFKQDFVNQNIQIKGWVKTARHSKNLSFIELSDGSCFTGLQIIADANLSNYTDIQKIQTGYSLIVEGKLVDSPAKGQQFELQASQIQIVGEAEPDYPLQKKRHSFEFLREIAHLRMRTNTISAVMRVRNAASFAIHRFFQERDFLYLHSPIISTSDCEGAGEMFTVTNFDLNDLPHDETKQVDYKKDFFGKRASLTVSGQLEGEIAAHAFQNIYTFGPTFRAENSHTSRHLAEFWMVEPEMAFCDLQGDMSLAEDFLKYIIQYVLNHVQDDMDFFNERIDPNVLQNLQSILSSSFEHMTYTQAIDVLQKSSKKFEHPVKWGIDLQSEHERYLTEEYVKKPLIVTDYPKDIKAFYMYCNEDDKTVRAMDVLVPRVGEIIGGAQREDRYDVLKNRMQSMGLNPKEYWWYLDLRRYGGVPHAGFGLGFERLIQFLTGVANIREVIPFPRVPGYAEF